MDPHDRQTGDTGPEPLDMRPIAAAVPADEAYSPAPQNDPPPGHRLGRVIAGAAATGAVLLGAAAFAVVANRDPAYDDTRAYREFAGSPLATVLVPADVALPRASSGHPLRPTDLTLVVGKDSLRFPVSGLRLPIPPDRAHGFEWRDKRSGSQNDLYVVPLAHAFQWVWDNACREWDSDTQSYRPNPKPVAGACPPPDARLNLVVDVDTPYRLLTEVMYTARQTSWARFSLAVRDAQQVTVLDIEPPRPPQPHGMLSESAVALDVRADGITIRGPGGNVAPGCESLGAGLTIGKRGAGYDLVALTRCLSRLKRSSPDLADERTVSIAASPDIPLHDVLSTIDAVRKGEDGQDLFPSFTLGVAR